MIFEGETSLYSAVLFRTRLHKMRYQWLRENLWEDYFLKGRIKWSIQQCNSQLWCKWINIIGLLLHFPWEDSLFGVSDIECRWIEPGKNGLKIKTWFLNFWESKLLFKKKASNFSGEPNMQMSKLWDQKKQSGNIYEMFSCRLEV